MFSTATPVIIISHPATENRAPSMRFIQQNWIRVTPKLLYNYSCMHMKVRCKSLDPNHSYLSNNTSTVHVGAIELVPRWVHALTFSIRSCSTGRAGYESV